jgi:hypothetical protein
VFYPQSACVKEYFWVRESLYADLMVDHLVKVRFIGR